MINKLVSYFLNGLAFVLPIAITIWLVTYFLDIFNQYLTVRSALLGLAILVVSLIPLGYITSSLLGIKAWRKIEQVIFIIPLVGLIYKAIKDVVTAFIGQENKFSEPVKVEIYPGPIYKIGFITNNRASEISGEIELKGEEEKFVLVYFPISFSVAGDLYLVPRSKITPINKKAKDVMQTIVSGGMINID